MNGLKAGSLRSGSAFNYRSVEVAKAMKSAGFDWLFIDLEHGALSVETAAQIFIAALDAGISPLVRIPNSEFSLGTQLWTTARSKSSYRMSGRRRKQGRSSSASVTRRKAIAPSSATCRSSITRRCPAWRLAQQGKPDRGDAESENAVGAAGAIAGVPGIDVLLIGTSDLCIDMGLPDEFGHDKVAKAYEYTIAACPSTASGRGWAACMTRS